MASKDSTPVRELSDAELRKRLQALGFDVPVSVNREFLMRKLEKAAGGDSKSGKGSSKRHSMAVTPSSSSSSPSTARKRKSVAVTGTSTPSNHSSGSSSSRSHHQNNINSPPISPLDTTPRTPPHYDYGSGNSSMSISTPSTPSPFVSRLNTPSPSSSPVNNGEPPSPRFMSYYNMFKSTPNPVGGMTPTSSTGAVDGGYGYAYNRSIRMPSAMGHGPVSSVAPPTRADRNGYATGNGGGVESDWCGGHLVSKVLVAAFIIFFVIIGLLYLKQSLDVKPRGLPGAVSVDTPAKVVKEPPPPPQPKKEKVPQLPTSMIYPICGTKGTDSEACIPKDIVKNSRTLFNAIKTELVDRAKKKGCTSDAREIVSLQEARTLLYTLTDLRKADVDAAFQGMLLLVTENPRQGVALSSKFNDDQEITSKSVVSGLDMSLTMISVPDVNPEFICVMKELITSLTMTVTVVAGCCGAGVILWKLYGWHRQRKKSQEEEMFAYVEKVLIMLRDQFDLYDIGQGPAFLAVNHVRDELLTPQERIKKEALWNKVVHHISNNESRVREEIQHIQGEEFKVWRWLPSASPLVTKRFSTANSHKVNRHSMPVSPASASSSPFAPLTSTPNANMGIPAQQLQQSQNNLYPSLNALNGDVDDEDSSGSGSDPNSNNKWQGQAFETCEGSPNALPISPTTCLKIRHMFTERDAVASNRIRVEQEILGKCKDAKILHIGIDQASIEGCVYIRCLTKEDARKAFMSLHGWWFDGHLLSVKFLREERYFSRFPEAKSCTAPMSLPR